MIRTFPGFYCSSFSFRYSTSTSSFLCGACLLRMTGHNFLIGRNRPMTSSYDEIAVDLLILLPGVLTVFLLSVILS